MLDFGFGGGSNEKRVPHRSQNDSVSVSATGTPVWEEETIGRVPTVATQVTVPTGIGDEGRPLVPPTPDDGPDLHRRSRAHRTLMRRRHAIRNGSAGGRSGIPC